MGGVDDHGSMTAAGHLPEFSQKCLPLLPPLEKVLKFRYVAMSMAAGLPPLAAPPIGAHLLDVWRKRIGEEYVFVDVASPPPPAALVSLAFRGVRGYVSIYNFTHRLILCRCY